MGTDDVVSFDACIHLRSDMLLLTHFSLPLFVSVALYMCTCLLYMCRAVSLTLRRETPRRDLEQTKIVALAEVLNDGRRSMRTKDEIAQRNRMRVQSR